MHVQVVLKHVQDINGSSVQNDELNLKSMNKDYQILLNGVTIDQLVEVFRPMIKEEIWTLRAKDQEQLISPAETCKVFNPSITKATLSSWTKQGLLNEYRIGGRVFYKKSEVLESSKKIIKYKSIYEKVK
jgi:hypothetical protein